MDDSLPLSDEKAKDEAWPAHPETEISRAFIEAEDRLAAVLSASQIPLVICRLGGLYGPGRSFLDATRRLKRF